MAGRISSPGSSASLQDTPVETKSSRALSQAGGNASAESDRKSQRLVRAASGSASDRLARLESIVRGEEPLDRNRALLAYIDQLAPGDFEAAVEHFRSLGITESRMGEYSMLLAAWAKADPLAALTYAQANTNNRFAANTILTTWAFTDPQAAIRWAEANHQGEGANPYLAGIIRAIGGSDPQRATELLAGMPRSRERREALDAMLPHLLTQGAEATQAWISGLTDETLRNGAMLSSADKLAAMDPAGTAAWLLANPGEASQRRMDDVYSEWARKDEQAAMNSLAALPSGESRSSALRGVVSSVAIKDPKAAMSVMDRFPNDVNDRVLGNFVWHSLGNDPSMAVNQISRIGDPGQRERMYGRVLETWLDRDPAAATKWIQANPLPQPVQDRLASRLNSQQ